jgi:hypothetical protein
MIYAVVTGGVKIVRPVHLVYAFSSTDLAMINFIAKSSLPAASSTPAMTTTPILQNSNSYSPSTLSNPNNNSRAGSGMNDQDRLHRERERNDRDRDGRGTTPSSRFPGSFGSTNTNNINSNTSSNLNGNVISLGSSNALIPPSSASKRKRDQSPQPTSSSGVTAGNTTFPPTISTAVNSEISTPLLSPTTATAATVEKEPDWVTMFNPTVKRVLDVGLVHTLPHDS